MKDELFKYGFASKGDKTLCVKYNEPWEPIWWEYLYDKGYTIRSASEQHWTRKIDEVGNVCECYLLDNETQFFDIGED